VRKIVKKMKITESGIKKLIKESVFKILREYQNMDEAGEILHRGEEVILRGEYPAIVCQDEYPTFTGEIPKIKLTTQDAFGTPEEENYSDWYPKDEISYANKEI